MRYYVDAEKGSLNGSGTKAKPFLKIQSAADIAVPGDEIIVMPGVYRENVDPKNAGTKEAPIVYRSERPLEAVISGAYKTENWEHFKDDVYKTDIPMAVFNGEDPFSELISGDWYRGVSKHRGDVYLNGRAMYEAVCLDDVILPKIYEKSWEKEMSLYVWYAEKNDDSITIYANFQGLDPNRENVEITVRRNCFYPQKTGVDHITVSGFKLCMASPDWAPPTAYQEGLIGPHWSKGWVIENCEIFGSKCAGISLGKYYQEENDNKWGKYHLKDGTQTQRECICLALNDGWSKEKVGSHIIRNCDIHHCEQAGIVGHLGCAFSTIENNSIHHINNKQELIGEEIAGIKFHAGIDVTVKNNRIYFCTRGLWLDWQAQGARVSRNLFYDNTLPVTDNDTDVKTIDNSEIGEDLFIEVSHGPTLIDNNIFLSHRSIKFCAQGAAFVNNIIAGGITAVGFGVNNGSVGYPSPRYTPYHLPHSTAIAGFMTILHGDTRLYNNIFIKREVPDVIKRLMEHMENKVKTIPGQDWDNGNVYSGSSCFDSFPVYEDWKKMFGTAADNTDRYYSPLPVWISGNVYFGGAEKYKNETNYTEIKEEPLFEIKKENGKIFIETDVYKYIKNIKTDAVDAKMLGMAFEPEQPFDSPDGTMPEIDIDYFGNRAKKGYVGCFYGKNDNFSTEL